MNNIDKIMQNSLSDNALLMLKTLNDNGFESFAVGGCVRDALLGITPKDEDVTTNATPEEVINLFEGLGYNVVPTGLQHGTVTVMVGKEGFEITTYRSDGDYSDGRHPDSVKFETDITKDLERRDLTINAFAWSPRDGFIDKFNGLSDLENKKIRAVGDANKRIEEDALRMMRAIRFSAKYGYEIEDSLWEAIKNHSSDITKVSKERIRDELCKTLMTDNPTFVKKFYETGLLKHISPELNEIFECPQNSKYHLWDVGNHTMKVLEDSSKDLITRTAILFHDIGKPSMKTVGKDGYDHFLDHQEASYYISRNILQDLKFSADEVRDISDLVRHHDAFNNTPEDKIHKHLRDFIIENPEFDETFYNRLFEIKKLDLAGHNTSLESISSRFEVTDKMKEELDKILSGPHTFKDLALNGYDIMNVEREKNNKIYKCSGPAIKEMQKILLREVIDNPSINNKEELLALCERKVLEANSNVEISKKKKIDKENYCLRVVDKVDSYYEQKNALKEKENMVNIEREL